MFFGEMRQLLLCGKLEHIPHPFELDNIKTGNDLITVFKKIVRSVQGGSATLKVDGFNTSLKVVTDATGRTRFAIDGGSNKEQDVDGTTEDNAKTFFKPGHGFIAVAETILPALNAALPSVRGDLEKLGVVQKNPDDVMLLNTEYISGQTNLVDYGDKKMLVLHGLVHVHRGPNDTSRKKDQVDRDLSALAKKLDPMLRKSIGFRVFARFPTRINGRINLDSVLSQQFTINGVGTKSMKDWLGGAENPKVGQVLLTSGKRVSPTNTQLYIAAERGDDVTKLVDPKFLSRAVNGIIMMHATRKMGAEILKNMSIENKDVGDGFEGHEGIVVKDSSITGDPNQAVKVTGEFMVNRLQSKFNTATPAKNETFEGLYRKLVLEEKR